MSEWKEYSVSEICEKITDGSHFSPKEAKNGNRIIATVKDMTESSFDYEECKRISEEDYLDLVRSGCKAEKDDVLLSKDGTIGLVQLFKDNIDLVLLSSIAILKANYSVVRPEFLSHLLKSPNLQNDIKENFKTGSALPRITLKDFKLIRVKLPPLPEQHAIAGVLSGLADKINLLYRQNKTLEAMAKALWWKIFVEDADPGWKKGKLDDFITSLETGRRPKGGIDHNLTVGVPSIGAESINGLGNYDFDKTKYITEEYYDQMNSGKIQNYDILIYKDGAYIGKKSMFANGFPFEKCCINEHVFVLRTGKVNSQLFLYFVLEQEELEQLNANSAQPGLNQEALKSFEIIYPDKDLIDDFGSKAKPLIDKIFMNSVQTRSLSRLRDTVLPKLMSGEMRVKL